MRLRSRGAALRSALPGVALLAWCARGAAQSPSEAGRELAPRPPPAPQAEERGATTGEGEGGQAPRNWGNLRVGGSTGGSAGRPEICAELSPLAFVSLEACGTGAGVWHRDPASETAHFRANFRLASLAVGRAWLEPRVGAGLAELSVGPDDAGFRFTSSGPRRVETAGPEAAGSLRFLYPVAHGIEAVGNLSFGAAWLPHAPDLAVPQAKFQPFLGASLGAGF
ncbi:MAG TPA: hypothetical protein VFS00_03290 [Polyangiaceae bacterium]|nr:hypothetical protein [Polyangiaceae bacterium]